MSPCAVLMPPGKTSTSSSSQMACQLLGEGGTMSLKRSENARTYKGKQGSLQKCERKRDLRIPVHQRGHLCFYFFSCFVLIFTLKSENIASISFGGAAKKMGETWNNMLPTGIRRRLRCKKNQTKEGCCFILTLLLDK